MTLERRLAALERAVDVAAGPNARRAAGVIADQCPGCAACVFIVFPFPGCTREEGVALCTLCRHWFVTTAGVAFVEQELARNPTGRLARATDEAIRRDRDGAQRAFWGAVLEELGVPPRDAPWWREALEAERAKLHALTGTVVPSRTFHQD
ncbi:MAG TPA: hypothetical protein VFS08_10440 [Gemmatimonadaceae bacterium]|nr:hypothetical protein [Gemmatimonadaceae bacterium]